MRAVIIDDESLVLDDLTRQLEAIGVEVVGQFVNLKEGLQAVLARDPDVVFLDIKMPGISGIELAEQIMQSHRRREIVFVTAFDQFAVQAFELNAVDYILKPVQKERLTETIRRVHDRLRARPQGDETPQFYVRVNMFGEVRVDAGAGPVSPNWRTTKALELFAYLVHQGGGPVSRDALLEVLWPGTEPRRASTLLYTTVYQVRSTLKKVAPQITLQSSFQAYRLAPEKILVTDAAQWVQDLKNAPDIGPGTIKLHQELVDRQPQDYLGSYDFFWAEPERHRLRTLWLQQALRVAGYWLDTGSAPEALALYCEILQRHPHVETAHLGLMRCYARLGDRSAVMKHYQEFTTMLAGEYGWEPSPEVVGWYEEWLRQAGT